MTREFPVGLGLLTSMITPAVLISACGTLVFSTSTRLARIVDRVRSLSRDMRSLTAFYVSLGFFVAATIAIGLTAFVPEASFVPSLLGIAGTAELFHGSVLLIREMRLAQKAVDSEMEFTLRLGTLYQARHGLAPGLAPSEDLNPWERLRGLFEREVKGGAKNPRG
jgi:hypothetical protein